MTYEIGEIRSFQDKKKQWRWHLKAGNGRVIAHGEAHSRKADAQRAIDAVRKAVHGIFPAWAIRSVEVNMADLKEKWDGL